MLVGAVPAVALKGAEECVRFAHPIAEVAGPAAP
jgi:hypothetical protein